MPAPVTRSSGVVPAALRVLVVEDDDDSRELLGMLLERAGCAVCLASSAGEAIEAAVLFRPAVVVTDIGLPDLDGFELARRLRELPALDPCRMVAVTGYSARDAAQRLGQAGFVAHLTKPVSLEALILAVSGAGDPLSAAPTG